MFSMTSGIVMIVLGAVGMYFLSRRQFHRTNDAGVQEFSGHSAMLGARLIEGLVRFLSIVLLVVGGVTVLIDIL